MANLKRLLNKKGWTGRELGILEVSNMAICFSQALSGEEPKPLFDKAQFRKMLNSLTDSGQGRIYNGYISIHEWLSLSYNAAQAHLQQVQLRYRAISSYIEDAILTEDVYSYIAKLPVIMTQKQYEDALEQGRQEWLSGKGDSLLNLIYRATEYYIEKLNAEPSKANPLKAIRKKYLAQPVKSDFILSRWNEATGAGYYMLEDGRRSDQMTDEEWQEAITTPKMKETLRAMDGEGLADMTASQVAYLRITNRSKVIFNGGTEAEADKFQQEEDYKAGLATPAKWHTYEEPPTDLTKWEVIEDPATVYEIFLNSLGGGDDSEDGKAFTEEAKIFLEEFSELVAVIIKELDKKYFNGEKKLFEIPVKGKEPLQSLATVPVEQWYNTVFDWEQLYNIDFYGMREEANRKDIIFDGNWRAIANGIAIIEPPQFRFNSVVDERGYYIPPVVNNSMDAHSLLSFCQDSEDYAFNTDEIIKSRKSLLESYRWIKGYNTAIDLIASYFDLKAIECFKFNIADIEEKIDALNELVPMLYARIKRTDYEDKELQARKMGVLKDFFQPIRYKHLTITEEDKEAAAALFSDFTAFIDDNLTAILCTVELPEEEEDGEGAGE